MTSTAVPQPTFGPNGFVLPAEQDILNGVVTDLNAAFGGNLNPSLSTPQGQLASSEAAVIGDANATFLWFVNQVDPAFSSGRMQDAIARIYFISRNPAQPTVAQATCTGLPGVIIPVGALAKATDGNLYVCQAQGVISGSGSIVLPFACATTGPIACPANSLNTIYQAIYGWDTINNAADGALGNVVESRAAFEARRSASTGLNAMGPLGAIYGAVLAVSGVLDAYVFENDAGMPVTVGGVYLAANSIYVCVLGGLASAVAFAIWSRKMPGCVYNGNTTVVVTDPNPAYHAPAPSYNVTFEIPSPVGFTVLVALTNNVGIPANALALVQQAVINAFAGADGGSRAKIGSTVYASRYYAPVIALGSWASQIVSIKLATVPAAHFTGSVSGSTLTVTGIVSGTLAVGQLIRDTSGLLMQGTTIRAFQSGTGGTGTYTVSQGQSVASENMTAVTMYDDITMNINQAPTVAAGDINLALQ